MLGWADHRPRGPAAPPPAPRVQAYSRQAPSRAHPKATMMSGDPSGPSSRLAMALVVQTSRARQPGQPAAAVRTASRLRRAECRIRTPGDIAPAVAAQVIDVRRIRLGRQAAQQPGNQALEGSGHRAILDPSIHAYASPGRFMPTCGRLAPGMAGQ